MYRAISLAVMLLFPMTVMGAEQGAAAPAPPESPARTIPDTVMFSIDEINDVRSRASSNTDNDAGTGNRDAIESATLYLSTILFYGPNDWTIWVNGAPITPRQDFSSFQVTSIGPDFVELLVPLSARGMSPVRLSPNQTFVARSGAIVEGKWQ